MADAVASTLSARPVTHAAVCPCEQCKAHGGARCGLVWQETAGQAVLRAERGYAAGTCRPCFARGELRRRIVKRKRQCRCPGCEEHAGPCLRLVDGDWQCRPCAHRIPAEAQYRPGFHGCAGCGLEISTLDRLGMPLVRCRHCVEEAQRRAARILALRAPS